MGVGTRGRQLLGSQRLLVALVAPAAYVVFLRVREYTSPASHEDLSALGTGLVVLVCVGLLFCWKWPLPVFGGIAAIALSSVAVDGAYLALAFAVGIAAFMATALDGRLWTGVSCAGVAVAMGLGWLIRDSGAWQSALNMTLGILCFSALGLVVHSRRERVLDMEERARRAEHTREQEARRRVAEERLRIARELHDVVGHHIALINVQATVAAHVMESKPEQAQEALSHVRHASRTVLEEISVLLGVLHQPDENERQPAEPVPTLSRLDSLIATFTTAGMAVEHRTFSPSTTVPTAVDLTAYRIVQESLTNVAKHAGGATAAVTLVQATGELRVEVRNARGPALPTNGGAGRGIVGMRARVDAIGGRLETGATPDGGFLVRAVLPIPDGGTG